MTVVQAEDKLVTKYPSYLKESDELAEIVEFLGRFGEGDIDKIWESFRMNYGYTSAPRVSVFNKAANESGARFKAGAQKAYEFVCYICGARYFLDKTACPSCGNHDKTWRALIVAGGYRGGKLKKEIEDEREMLMNERNR